MTTGGYGAGFVLKIRPIGHGSVGDEVVPSNAYDTPLASHAECL